MSSLVYIISWYYTNIFLYYRYIISGVGAGRPGGRPLTPPIMQQGGPGPPNNLAIYVTVYAQRDHMSPKIFFSSGFRSFNILRINRSKFDTLLTTFVYLSLLIALLFTGLMLFWVILPIHLGPPNPQLLPTPLIINVCDISYNILTPRYMITINSCKRWGPSLL